MLRFAVHGEGHVLRTSMYRVTDGLKYSMSADVFSVADCVFLIQRVVGYIPVVFAFVYI